MQLKKIVLLIILIWLVGIIIPGGLFLRTITPTKDRSTLPPPENGVRLAFFADPHLINEKEGTETDIGGPGYEALEDAKYSLNSCNPSYIFGLGDLTAHGTTKGWKGYKNWIGGLKAPVYDFLGNHDKDHLFGTESGPGYFNILDRVSDTKVLKMGNNVFILVSEEHDWEGDGDLLMSTIPQKRFEFIENQLKKYSDSNNIFIMNHTPLSGTVAFSKTWFYGNNPNWIHISDKFLDLLGSYNVDVHISGHIHTDYRFRDEPCDQDGTTGVEGIGKFVSGTKINNSNRKYPPYNLPETYFLNMLVVDYAHNWIGARFNFVGKIFTYYYPKLDPSAQKVAPSKQKEKVMKGRTGPRIVDLLHSTRNSYFTGRGAVYHFDMENGENSVDVITRWIGGNRDVGRYTVNLGHPIELGDGEMHLVSSDLSLRRSENLTIILDNWFKIESGCTGMGEFSKVFYGENKLITGLSIENHNLENYSAEWMGSTDLGNSWENTWHQDPENMGEVNAVKIKIHFQAPNQEDAYIEDINIKFKV